jgi:DNA helicase II / ATP-dependent DNA helicase PcrA
MNQIIIEEIEHASSILFNGDRNKFYDDIEQKVGERIVVIQSLENINVTACPGSGKTTALLAKLIILANRMPFEDGRGICVLTHTNVAIDLIKEKLGARASKLFTHPNFFGTIQSFVDRFLAAPAIIESYGVKPDIVDNEKANAQLFDRYFKSRTKLNNRVFITLFAKFSQFTTSDFSSLLKINKQESLEILKILKHEEIIESKRSPYHLNYANTKKEIIEKKIGKHPIATEIKNVLLKIIHFAYQQSNNSSNQIAELKKLNLDFIRGVVLENEDNYGGFETSSGKAFLELKEECFKNGLITFSDAYQFAALYLNKYPEISKAFMERFKFVFVDEMQDTAAHQMEIIDKLFKTGSDSIVQYYGDPNQAIFEGEAQNYGGWNPKPDQPTTLTLKKSKRFGQAIANVITPLRIIVDSGNTIEGENSYTNIKPHLILFEKERDTERVIQTFGAIIVQNNLDKVENYKFVAIGRVGKEHEKGELSLKSFWPEFEKSKYQKKEYYPFLILYLNYHLNKTKSIKSISDQLIKGILQALDLHNFKHEITRKHNSEVPARRFSKITLLNFLKSNYEDIYFELKEKLIKWSNQIYTEKLPFNIEIKMQIEIFLEERLLQIKGIEIDSSLNFFQIPDLVLKEIEIAKSNEFEMSHVEPNEFVYKYTDGEITKEIPIKLNTIHGEKGETHTATLYLETYFRKKHDSEQIRLQLLGEPFDQEQDAGKEKNMAIKMAYVAMSRPKYLLCFALQKNLIEDILNTQEQNEKLKKLWTILEV